MSNFFCVVGGGQEATTGGGCARCGTAAGSRPFPVAAGRAPVTTIPAPLACPVCNRSWSLQHSGAGEHAGEVTVPELTGCCPNCGAKPELTMGPVNDTVCIGVKPTCDCIKRGAPYSSFSLWPAHGVSAKPATLRDEGMRVHHVAPDMRRGWCKCGHHRGEHGPIAGDAEHGLDEWGACLQCDCPLYAFDAEQTAAIREIISRSTPTERGACEFCGARNVPTDHVCAEAGGTERRE